MSLVSNVICFADFLSANAKELAQKSRITTDQLPNQKYVFRVQIFNWLRNASWTVVDMGTGRYLYTKWSERQRELAGHANSQRVGSQAKSSSIHAN